MVLLDDDKQHLPIPQDPGPLLDVLCGKSDAVLHPSDGARHLKLPEEEGSPVRDCVLAVSHRCLDGLPGHNDRHE